MTVQLGLTAAPGPATELAEQLAEDLPDLLHDRVSDDVLWSVSVSSDEFTGDVPLGGVEAIDLTRDLMLREGWDLAIRISDRPLRIGRRPVVAHASEIHRVGLVSLPALGALHLRKRAGDAVVRIVDGLLGEGVGRHRNGRGRGLRIARRLAELTAPVRPETPDDGDDVDLRFVAAVVRGNLRLLSGMVRANRPWRLIVELSRALAAAVAAAVFALVTSDVWRIADQAGWPSLLALSLAAVGGTIVWLIAAHGLWERAEDPGDREDIVLFNVATALTVVLGVACHYAALFVVSLAGVRVLIHPDLLAQVLGHGATFADYAALAWMVSSLATVGGALGSAVESDVAVREAAYGYRAEQGNDGR